ncbi:allergen Tha p 1-like [Belonocnema kinseyi]|uniref:allergen Tha p 1-like n=1 Tax=Belonocnema kinseyi TaxID=2817044 RepID=UPI00143CC951|nr:allergen Tha p 1-like [Belonocnema kinseyi]
MLKITSLSVVLIAILFSCVATEEKEKKEMYGDKYDYVDYHAIMESPRLRDQYYNCFMELGPCLTADQKFFKDLIPDVFQTKCSKCSEKQKMAFEQIVEFYVTKFPDKWEAVIRKFVIEPARSKKNE